MDVKYIGIPYVLGGRDFSGCDCYGLVYLYLQEQHYTLPRYNFSYTLEESKSLIEKEAPLLLGELLDAPEENAVVLLYVRGKPTHIGVYTSGGILHTSSDKDSIFEVLGARTLQRFSKLEFYRVDTSYCTKASL